MTSDTRHKIVIDTDCGVDDSIALLLALSSKDIAETLAITCCFGTTIVDNVCANVMRVLTLCDEKEIPVHRGCAGPLLKGPITARVSSIHGGDGLGNRANEFSTGDLKESEIPAPLALINLVKKYPQQITVIAIGPLTNLAVAHRIDPTFTKNLKSIFIMGGNYKGLGNIRGVAEFNFYSDPEAANIMVSEAACQVVLFPYETATDYGIKWDFYSELLKTNTKKGNFFKRVIEHPANRAKERGNKQVNVPDVLAVVALLYPQCITSRFKSHLAVECEGTFTKGLAILLHDSPNISDREKVDIITDFDIDFLNSVLKRILY